MELASILSRHDCGSGQWLLRLNVNAPDMVLPPGSTLTSPNGPAMLMRSSPHGDWIDVLLRSVNEAPPTESLPFTLNPQQSPLRAPQGRHVVLIGQGFGLAAAIDLCDRLRRDKDLTLLVLLENDLPLPLRPQPSHILTPGMPDGVIATVPLLEDWHVPCRLAVDGGSPGCYDGSVIRLLEEWLATQSITSLATTEIIACVPAEALPQLQSLAEQYETYWQGLSTQQ